MTPDASMTYELVAKGPGGTNEASTRITVNAPVASAAPSPTDEELFSRNIKDVFFDYDKYAIRPTEAPTVQNDGAFLSQHPSIKVMVEGHCDDRGSEEYNIALGASRAETVKRTLMQGGVPADRVRPSAMVRKSHSDPGKRTMLARTGWITSSLNVEFFRKLRAARFRGRPSIRMLYAS